MQVSEALTRIREQVDLLTRIVGADHAALEHSPLSLERLRNVLSLVEQLVPENTGGKDVENPTGS